MFTKKEVAALLKVHPNTVDLWINRTRNRLKALKLGKRLVRIPEDALKEFITRNAKYSARGGAR